VTGNATFDYHAQRTTTVDKLETKTFKDGEKTTITNGRVLDITSGGDKITVKGDKTTTVDGNEEHHVTGKITEKYDSGQDTTIASGGMKVNVNGGNWEQNVKSGTIAIYSPDLIKITSDTKVMIESPTFETKDHHKHTFAQKAVSYISEHVKGELLSVTAKGLAFSYAQTNISVTPISISHKSFEQKNSAMELKTIGSFISSGAIHWSSKALTLLL